MNLRLTVVAWFVMVLAGILMPGSAASAHSSLIAASPSPGQAAGGDIDLIELVFDAGVSDATIIVESPDGQVVEGELAAPAPNVLTYAVDPADMDQEGNWTVRYAFISEDTDPVSLFYAFRYDPEAPAPLPISASTGTATSASVTTADSPDGLSPVLIVAVVGTLVLLGGAVFASRRARAA